MLLSQIYFYLKLKFICIWCADIFVIYQNKIHPLRKSRWSQIIHIYFYEILYIQYYLNGVSSIRGCNDASKKRHSISEFVK